MLPLRECNEFVWSEECYREAEFRNTPIGVMKAVLAERERCAKIAEEFERDCGGGFTCVCGEAIAEAIRSGK